MSETNDAGTEDRPVEEPTEELSEVQAAARRKEVINLGGGAVACVICEKRSYPAETIYFEKIPYHVDCFRCIKCNRKIEGVFNAAMFEYKLYCRRCFQHDNLNRLQAQVKWRPSTSSGSQASGAFAKLGGGSVPCAVCNKACYPAETANFEGKVYHDRCLACSECNTGCTVNNIFQYDNKLYCNKCWTKHNFNRKQLETASKWKPSTSGGSATQSGQFSSLGGGGIKCFDCNKTVYPAEAINYETRVYHPKCFRCNNCQQRIQTINHAEHKGPIPYCKRCFTQLELWRPDK
uniref:Cysteine and glycine-rich protein 2 n=1 Tax=Lygus hesperus TaxID=30085 RepID=A0A0A9XKD2_LYGHE